MWAETGRRKNWAGALDLRAPEDQVSSGPQARERFRKPIVSGEIDRAIHDLFDSWKNGDESSTRIAAAHLVERTGAHYELQGVPVFSRPVLPPQFSDAVQKMIGGVPEGHARGLIDDLVTKFDDGVKLQVSRELQRPSQPFGSQGLNGLHAANGVSGISGALSDRAGEWVNSYGRSGNYEVALRFDGMEDDVRPGVPGTGSRPDTPREPPREVHPPLRPDTRDEECADLRREIASLRMARGSWISEGRRLKSTLETWYDSWLANERALEKKKERLSALEYQLRLFELPWPLSPPPKRLNPREPGPLPDIFGFGIAGEVRRQIARLRIEIAELERIISRQKERIADARRKLDAVEGKFREAERLLVEPERQYRLRCGALEPPLGEWR